MNLLMLCTRFPLEAGNKYLTNELADALAAQGHAVQVVLLDWDAPPGRPARELTLETGVKVLAIAPRSLRGMGKLVEKGSKWLLSSLFAMRDMRRLLGTRRFDGLICYSPATTIAAQAIWAMRVFRLPGYLVQWDFFPFHQRSIGLIDNDTAFAVARRIEETMIRRFDVIGCMSDMNIAYLRRNYRLRSGQRVELLPIWGETSPPEPAPRDEVRAAHELPTDRKIVVFGGQITQGRGIEEILEAATLAASSRPDISFLMIGEGRLEGLVKDHIANGGGNVIYRKRIPREQYLRLVAACDVGLVATVRDVEVPTFPSKIIDYLRAGIPVVASVEASTDYGRFVEEGGLGKAVEAGRPERLVEAVAALLDDPERGRAMAEAGKKCLDEVFDVSRAAGKVVAALADAGKANRQVPPAV